MLSIPKFSRGDRVKVYASSSILIGTISDVGPDNTIYIIEDKDFTGHKYGPYHEKQCRKLKPAKPRIRLWAFADCKHRAYSFVTEKPSQNEALYIEFVEVRRKKGKK